MRQTCLHALGNNSPCRCQPLRPGKLRKTAMNTLSSPPRAKLHYAWVVVGVTFLMMLIAAGSSRSIAVMMVPIEQEFGWSRATVSAAVSVNLVLFGLMGPFAAAIIEWLGVRVTM